MALDHPAAPVGSSDPQVMTRLCRTVAASDYDDAEIAQLDHAARRVERAADHHLGLEVP